MTIFSHGDWLVNLNVRYVSAYFMRSMLNEASENRIKGRTNEAWNYNLLSDSARMISNIWQLKWTLKFLTTFIWCSRNLSKFLKNQKKKKKMEENLSSCNYFDRVTFIDLHNEPDEFYDKTNWKNIFTAISSWRFWVFFCKITWKMSCIYSDNFKRKW